MIDKRLEIVITYVGIAENPPQIDLEFSAGARKIAGDLAQECGVHWADIVTHLLGEALDFAGCAADYRRRVAARSVMRATLT